MSEDKIEVKQEEPKGPGRPAKPVQIKNVSKRPITLIVSQSERVRVLPTQTADVDKELMAKIRKNKACMSFFDDEQLIEI